MKNNQNSPMAKLRSPYGLMVVLGCSFFAVSVLLGPFNVYPFLGMLVMMASIGVYKLNRISQALNEHNEIARATAYNTLDTSKALEAILEGQSQHAPPAPQAGPQHTRA